MNRLQRGALNQHLGLKVYGERKIKYCHQWQKKLYEIRTGGYYAVNIQLKCLDFLVVYETQEDLL